MKNEFNLDYDAIRDRIQLEFPDRKNAKWAKKLGIKTNRVTNVHGKDQANPSLRYIIHVSLATGKPIEYYLWGSESLSAREPDHEPDMEDLVKEMLGKTIDAITSLENSMKGLSDEIKACRSELREIKEFIGADADM